MKDILEILMNDARTTPDEIAKMVKKPVAAVKKQIKMYEENGTIVQYKAIVNPEMVEGNQNLVRALIQVSITPQKDVGLTISLNASIISPRSKVVTWFRAVMIFC